MTLAHELHRQLLRKGAIKPTDQWCEDVARAAIVSQGLESVYCAKPHGSFEAWFREAFGVDLTGKVVRRRA